MITDETIRSISRRYQTTELNVRREYWQHVFLANFYRHKAAAGIFFKGGTALRIIYGSPRFSEDLDFSSKPRIFSDLVKLAQSTIAETKREGILADLKESKMTSGGYFAIIEFSGGGQSAAVQIEISFRKKKLAGELTTITGDFIPAYTLWHLSREELAGEKIAALLDRAKPRDFYDLYFLLRANLLPPSQRQVAKKAAAILERADINFSRELKEFLPVAMHPVIKNFKMTLKRELARFL